MRHAGAFGVFLLAAFAVADVTTDGPGRVVRDINDAAGPEGHAWPQGFVDLGEASIFFASTKATGFELWRTDGTGAGTTLVKDIRPGTLSSVEGQQSSSTTPLVVRVGDLAFFPADDGDHGFELWRTDGTEAGTFLLADIRPGWPTGVEPTTDPSRSRQQSTLLPGGSLLYFTAKGATGGSDLWRTDGTNAGTFLLRENVGSLTLNATTVGATLLFAGHDAIHGSELWKSDGTVSGTVRITELVGGGVRVEGTVGSVALFSASQNGGDLQLWRSDGTAEGTRLVKDIRPHGARPFYPSIVADGKLYFLADDGVHGYELWRSDGTPEGTFLLKDILPGDESSYNLQMVGAHAGRVYFSVDDGVHGRELWVTDGTGGGTGLLADIIPGPGGCYGHGSFTPVGGTLYFLVNEAVHGSEVWTTDGTPGGTRQVTNVLTTYGPHALTAINGRLFYARGETVHGLEPWFTDGVDGGMLRDIHPGPSHSFSYAPPGRRGNVLLFGADDGTQGAELWATDGTPAGTKLLKNLNEYYRSAPSIQTLAGVELGDRLLFIAGESRHGQELWMTDGTGEGTQIVTDITPGPSGTFSYLGPGMFGDLGERAVFPVSDPFRGTELWVSDGTEAGTALLKDIQPGPNSSWPHQFTAIDSRVVFIADDGASGRELWVTDGTEAGTQLLLDDRPGPESSTIEGMVSLGGQIFFHTVDASWSWRLWRTDGTTSGTYPLAALGVGYAPPPVLFRGEVWFVPGGGSAPAELWKTDGTVAGTQRVAVMDPTDVHDLEVAGDLLFVSGYTYAASTNALWVSDGTGPGTRLVRETSAYDGGAVTSMTAVGNLVFYSSYDEVSDVELWVSDGTAEGTRLVEDINHIEGSYPEHLTAVEGVLLFSALHPDHGYELWRSDGTEAGTFLVQDILPGPESSSPASFVPFGTRIAFAATGDAVGREPFAGRPSILTRQPLRALEDLADQVRALGLPRGAESSLTAMLDAAAAALSRPGGSRVALGILDRFARQIERSPSIPQGAAAELLDFVREIEQILGVDNGSAPAVPVSGYGQSPPWKAMRAAPPVPLP